MKLTLRWRVAILAFVSWVGVAGASDVPPPLPGDEPGAAILPQPAVEAVKPIVAPVQRDSEARGDSKARHGHKHEMHARKARHGGADTAPRRHGKSEAAPVKPAKSMRQAKSAKPAKAVAVPRKPTPTAAHGKPAGKPKKRR